MIDLKNYYLDFWQRLFDFKGTASRSEFWLPVIVNYGVGCLVILGMAILQGVPLSTLLTTGGRDLQVVGRLILGVAWLTLLSIKVRRLHAVRLSGWWLLANCLPGIGGFLMAIVGVLPSKISA